MAKAKKIFRSAPLKDHGLEGLGWLLSVLSGAPSANADVLKIRRFLNNRLTETAAGAHFVSSMTDDTHLTLHSNRRTDGVLLDAFITDQPQSDVIAKAGSWAFGPSQKRPLGQHPGKCLYPSRP